MKRIRMIGLCLVAAFAIGAVASATASAEAPEYGRCTKGVAHEGGYTTAGCIATDKEDNDGIYSWTPGVVKAGFTNASSTGATLETIKGTKITCKTESSTGTITGEKTVSVPSVKFNGCTSSGVPCNTEGQGVEEIVTEALTGTLRVEKFGLEASKNKVANELVPTTVGGLFVTFHCSTFLVEVRKEATGGLLNTLVVNKMLKVSSNKYTATKGEQKPSEYESSKGKKVLSGLESNFAGGPFEEAGQTITSAQTNEELVEVNTVL